MKYDILNRFNGFVQVSVEIECAADASPRIKLGLAIRAAIKDGADLRSANLRYAGLSGADLSGADLSDANLRYAGLRYAGLSGADLSGADLSDADLSDADLRYAGLRGANLSGADLSGADLSGADLRYADLRYADLRYAKNSDLAIAMTRILPEGQIIGWKKLKNGTIAKLSIPSEAKRSHAFGRKCRAEFADVLEGEGVSIHDGKTEYAPGIRVTCDKWEPDWTQECAGGIHFFITREEAENYDG